MATEGDIGSVGLSIEAVLDAASFNAAQTAAVNQGRIIGTELARAIQDTVANRPIEIRPRVVGGADLSGFQRQALNPPSLPPPVPPAYFQQLEAARAAAGKFGGELGGVGTAAVSAAGGLTQMGTAVTVLQRAFAAFLAIQAVNSIRQVGNQSQASKIQLEALASGYGEVAEAQEKVARIANILNISNLEARQGFAELYAALRGTGVGVEQIEVLFVGLNNAARLSGAGAAQASAALLQLKQALSSGRLSGDELRSVLELMPILTQRLAEELGVASGQIKELGSQGKITAEVVFNATKKLAAELAPAKTATENISRAFTNLRERIAEAFGPAIVGTASRLAAAVSLLGQALEKNKDGITSTVSGIVQIGKVVVPLAIGVKAAELAMKGFELATRAATKASAILQAVSGPKGWLVLAVGVGVAIGAYKGLEEAIKGVDKAYADLQKKAAKDLADFQAELAGKNFNGETTGPSEKDLEKIGKQASELAKVRSEQANIIANSSREQGLAREINAIYADRSLSLESQRAAVDAITASYERQQQYADKLRQLDEVRAQISAQQAETEQARIAEYRLQAQQLTEVERLFTSGGSAKLAGQELARIQRDIQGSYTRLAADFNLAMSRLGKDVAISVKFDPEEQLSVFDANDRLNRQRAQAAADAALAKQAGEDTAKNIRDAGAAAAESAKDVGESAGQAIDSSAVKAAVAATQFAELQKEEARLVAEIKAFQLQASKDLRDVIAEISSGRLEIDLGRVDTGPIDGFSRGLLRTFEIGASRVAEVFEFAQGLLDQTGGSVGSVGEALIERLRTEGVGLIDGFNSSFNAAKEAAANLVQAADRLQGSRVSLERAGIISGQALQEGIQLALRTINASAQNNPLVDPALLANAVRDALRSDTPLAALNSLADTVRTSQTARQDLDTATKTFADATAKAVTAQNNLAGAINKLLPQIAVQVTVPVGSAATSNVPVRYAN